jgi:DNA primase
VALAGRGVRRPQLRVPAPARRRGPRENGEFVVLALLVQEWDSIAAWLIDALFADDVHRRAFLAVAGAEGSLQTALELADPEAREVLERAAVVDVDADPDVEARNLIAAAVRRELHAGARNSDPVQIQEDREARLHLEELHDVESGVAAADWLLAWLAGRNVTVPSGEPPTHGASSGEATQGGAHGER